MARALLLGALGLAAACSTLGPRPPALTQTALLSGAALSASPPLAAPITPAEVFGLDQAMRAFVATEVGGANDPGIKLQKLLTGMKGRGLFALDYTANQTRTPRATFDELQGNCLSATILFVAFAREAGLDASYQIVDVPPSWSDEADLVVVASHINALVETRTGRDYIVDFNLESYGDRYEKREVDDSYVLALFYNNLGAEALIRKEYDLSFRYFRAAIEVHPSIAASWANLGLLYSRQGFHAHAEAAYLQALAVNPREQPALTNLVSLYTTLGKRELADAYRERIRRYQKRNPYYHYAVAQAAYREQRFEDALVAVKRSVRLKRDEHEFYFLQGLAYAELGRRERAEKSFVRATQYAQPAEVRARYAATLQALGDPPAASQASQ
jgi:Flp pilus assembly protein TadD